MKGEALFVPSFMVIGRIEAELLTKNGKNRSELSARPVLSLTMDNSTGGGPVAAYFYKISKYFTEKHEYVDVDGDIGTIGITDYAQDKLGEVVYVQLPDVGMEVEQDGEAGVLESVKAASEVYSPVSGTVTEANDKLADSPKLVNESCYQDGWLYKMTISKPDELEHLMKEADYEKYIETI
ncbi:hypothetical protein FSP39_011446 [Pinctada imbricata]|uniref:Glycine cleavage system H protein n=1 Tax=Pinctada imbricata TaxID=66713 RepID=A0AA88XIP1_PINIB|nr:hypothetical protein FSP39_011446 [Pinctada imbricata]